MENQSISGNGDYWHIDTGGADDGPDGAMKRRKDPQEPVVNYVSVNSVDKFADKISKLGGKICMAKTAVPQMGYFAVCQGSRRQPLWTLGERSGGGLTNNLYASSSFVVVLKVSKQSTTN